MRESDGAHADAVFEAVRSIPQGKVATYGQVADMVAGYTVTARQVGQIMAACPKDVPWQRVVGSGGHLPIGKRSPELAMLQRRLLEQEGVAFLTDSRVDMARHQHSHDAAGNGLFGAT